MKHGFTCFDLETTDLKANWGHLLVASFLPLESDTVETFRLDDRKYRNRKDPSDDSRLVVAVRDYMEDCLGWIGWNCVSPEALTLTGDLRWKPIGDLQPGEELLAFSANPPPQRRWKRSIVVHNQPRKTEVWEIELADGSIFQSTYEHPWLTRAHGRHKGYHWTTTDGLMRNRSYLTRLLEPWSTLETRDAGWLAGIFDGEGCLHQKDVHSLALAQNNGPTLRRVEDLLTLFGFQWTECAYDPQNPKIRRVNILGGKRAILRFLGMIRPVRLLDNLQIEELGVLKSDYRPEASLVVRKERKGVRWISVLGTSSETYLVDGIGSHNSKLFDAAWIRTRLAMSKERQLAGRMHIDLMYYARRPYLALHSSRLEAVVDTFQLGVKTHMTPAIWKKAQLLEKSAMDYVVEHCEEDVKSTKGAFEVLSPFIKNIHY